MHAKSKGSRTKEQGLLFAAGSWHWLIFREVFIFLFAMVRWTGEEQGEGLGWPFSPLLFALWPHRIGWSIFPAAAFIFLLPPAGKEARRRGTGARG
jgi:hypothetical protein